MASEGDGRGKKRSKAFYRKSSHGGKRYCPGTNFLQPGIRGFLIMCHGNEPKAVQESYNILNEYGDAIYGSDKTNRPTDADGIGEDNDDSDDCEDIEKALKKEVDSIKNVIPAEKRFQNVMTKAKNCVFIRTSLDDPVKMVSTIMEDIASQKVNKARFAARMLPIVGTCKAQTPAIAELAKNCLAPYFSKESPNVPSHFTVMFKARNNNTTTCGKESIIPAIKKEVLAINPDLSFCWSGFDVAILVEIVCTVCCLGVAPGYERLRKFNFQELAQGPKERKAGQSDVSSESDTLLKQDTVETKASVEESDVIKEVSEETKDTECKGSEDVSSGTKASVQESGTVKEISEVTKDAECTGQEKLGAQNEVIQSNSYGDTKTEPLKEDSGDFSIQQSIEPESEITRSEVENSESKVTIIVVEDVLSKRGQEDSSVVSGGMGSSEKTDLVLETKT